MTKHKATFFSSALKGGMTRRVPFWLMRQAGRYLPEYQETRAKAGSFLNLAFTPELATEVTLQPIRRYNMDAAIIFSDILTVPYALGRALDYVDGEGPKLDPITTADEITALDPRHFHEKLQPVYDAISMTREKLDAEKSLIGFAGAPFTLACYMIEGHGSSDFARAKMFAYQNPDAFDDLITRLQSVTTEYLYHQVKAGADVVKLFDSWAGLLPQPYYDRWVVKPARHIIRNLRSHFPELPVICFPRGSGTLYKHFVQHTGTTAIAIDQFVDHTFAARELQPLCTLQGNLDPLLLVAGGKALDDGVHKVLTDLEKQPFIFNLGHGVLKQTPPEHVAQLAALLKANVRY